MPFVTQRFSDNGVGSREDQGYSPADEVDEMKGLGRGEGVGHQPVEEYPLTQHPRVSATLKVNLQEGEELTPRLKNSKNLYRLIFEIMICM